MQCEALKSQIAHIKAVRARINAPRVVVAKPSTTRVIVLRQPVVQSFIEAQRRREVSVQPCASWHVREYLLHKFEKEAAARSPAMTEIIRATSVVTGVSATDIVSERRDSKTTLARHIAMFLVRELTTISFPQMGRRFGCRNHGTVLHACRKIKARADAPDIAPLISEIRELLTVERA